MLRRQRDPTPFGRVVRPRLDPERRLLWRFDSDHIRGGPADDVPIIIRARPNEVPGVALEDYILELSVIFQTLMILLVNRYARRVHRRTLREATIRDLPIFFFPTDVLIS